MTILVYAFSHKKYHNLSNKILKKLNDCEKFIIDSTTNETALSDIAKLLEIIKDIKPESIIGLGEYGGKDNEYLRIETQSKNKFRNGKIGQVENYEISSEYKDLKVAGFKTANAMGNSFCNLSSYRIAEFIKENNLKIHQTFIHIPKNFEIDNAVSSIQKLITNFIAYKLKT